MGIYAYTVDVLTERANAVQTDPKSTWLNLTKPKSSQVESGRKLVATSASQRARSILGRTHVCSAHKFHIRMFHYGEACMQIWPKNEIFTMNAMGYFHNFFNDLQQVLFCFFRVFVTDSLDKVGHIQAW